MNPNLRNSLIYMGVYHRLCRSRVKIDDDVRALEIPFHKPPANHIACAFDFQDADSASYEKRTLTVPGHFSTVTSPGEVDEFRWPEPREHINSDEVRNAALGIPKGFAVMGVLWSAHFQDACSAFGMENAFMRMLTDPEVVHAVVERIVEFYLEANRMVYEAAADLLDTVLIGNDFAGQTGLLISRDLLREFVYPGTKKLVDQAHGYGLKVIHHSCGAIADLIPDLIELGVDAIHPIQALAHGMGAKSLKAAYGEKTSFCGGVDAQRLLITGTEDEVAREVRLLRELFPTGLIISPSHEAILPDTPPVNVDTLFRAVHE